jgi:hypothetical protein
MICEFFLSRFCLFHLPLVTECLLAPFCCVVAALTSTRARISALEAELRASQEAWESSTAAKVSAEKVTKQQRLRQKKLRRCLVMLSRSASSWNSPSLNDSIVFRLMLAVSLVLFPHDLLTRACVC